MTVSSGAHWPLEEPAYVAWLSSWETARAMPWPDFGGGPISIARRIRVGTSEEGVLQLEVRPAHRVVEQFCFSTTTPRRAGLAQLRFEGERLHLTLRTASAEVTVSADYLAGKLDVVRRAAPPLSWERTGRFPPSAGGERTLQLFVDVMVAELFLAEPGVAASIAVPGAREWLAVEAAIDGRPCALEWFTAEKAPAPMR